MKKKAFPQLLMILFTIILTVVSFSCKESSKTSPPTNSNQNEKSMDELWGESKTQERIIHKDTEWYKYSKFGMFIHFGLYSDAAGEWDGQHYHGINEWIMKRAKINTADYKKLASTFNPKKFNADNITQLAVDAGMKYIVVTTKHHDGFALFASEASDFNIVDATPYGKDPLKELARSCKEKGLKLGFYYSQTQDWTEKNGYGNTWEYNPEEADFDSYLNNKVFPQIREILSNYGEIACIWFDTPGPISKEQVVELKEMVDNLQPNCLINSRIGRGLGDFTTLGDNEIPDKPLSGLWESPDTHNNTWAYSDLDFNWKTPKEIITRLIDVVSRGGNYTFNIGPKGDGSVPEISASILRDVGKWTHLNSEAIYGSTPVYAGDQSNIAITQNKGKTYIFVKEKPNDGKIWLPPYEGQLTKSSLLSNNQPVVLKNTEEAIYIDLSLYECDLVPVIILESESPLVFETTKILNSGVETYFLPHEAKISGAEISTYRWMEVFGDWHTNTTICSWKKKGSKATWKFQVPEEGNYIIEIKYSCTAAADYQEGLMTINGEKHFFVPTFSGETGIIKNQRENRTVNVFKIRKFGIATFNKGKCELSIELNDIDQTGWISIAQVIIRPIEK